MTDTLQQVLDTPGCERLRDFAAVGPAQRAALELFVDRLVQKAVAAEREACARECEDVDANPHVVMHHAIVCAESIRARGQK